MQIAPLLQMDGAPPPDVKFWVHLICLSKCRIEIFCVLLLGKKFRGRQKVKGDVVFGFPERGIQVNAPWKLIHWKVNAIKHYWR